MKYWMAISFHLWQTFKQYLTTSPSVKCLKINTISSVGNSLIFSGSNILKKVKLFFVAYSVLTTHIVHCACVVVSVISKISLSNNAIFIVAFTKPLNTLKLTSHKHHMCGYLTFDFEAIITRKNIEIYFNFMLFFHC